MTLPQPIALPRPVEYAANDIISLMLNDADTCLRVEYEFSLRAEYMPNAETYRAYIAIQTMRKMGNKGELNDNELIKLAGNAINHDWISQRVSEGLDSRGRLDAILLQHLSSNALIVREYGRGQMLFEKLTQQAAALKSGQSVDETIAQSMTILVGAGVTDRIENEYAHENGSEFERMMESEPPPAIESGIPDVDRMVGGFVLGRFWALISAMKMRKTTMVINWILAALFSNPDVSVSFYSAEMPRNQVIGQMCAMLAVAWQLKNGVFSQNHKSNFISGSMLVAAGKRYRNWGHPATQSVSEAIRIYKSFEKRLQIYDTEGGLRNLDDAQRFFKRSVAVNGSQLHFFDYFTKLLMPGDLVAQSKYGADTFADMAKGNNCAVVVLAQKNASAIKNEDSHLVGAMGGIALEAAADYNWTTNYDAHETPDKVQLTLKQSRHSGVGSIALNIHPDSGLIFDASWIVNVK